MPEFPADLSGDGLRLRRLDRRDADDLARIRSNEETRQWVDPAVVTRDRAAAVIGDANEKARAGTAALYGITDPGDDTLQGTIDIFFHEHARATIGYGVAPEARGRGLATGAVTTLSGWAFEHVPALVRLELLVMPGNVASIIVAERAGFRREGILRSVYPYGDEHRDVIVFSLLRSDGRDRSPARVFRYGLRDVPANLRA